MPTNFCTENAPIRRPKMHPKIASEPPEKIDTALLSLFLKMIKPLLLLDGIFPRICHRLDSKTVVPGTQQTLTLLPKGVPGWTRKTPPSCSHYRLGGTGRKA